MIYRERKKLTIIELGIKDETVSFAMIEKVILERPSDIIYCERNKKLYGIITMGDVGRASDSDNEWVTVNTRFKVILNGEYMKAREIFLREKHINELPVLDENGVLVGDWTRWNDITVERHMFIGNAKCYKGSHIAYIRPYSGEVQEKTNAFMLHCKMLESVGVNVERIDFEDISKYNGIVEYYLFVNEDERRAFQALYKYLRYQGLIYERFRSYRHYVCIKFNRGLDVSCLFNIKEKGVYIFNMVFRQDEYYKKMIELAQSKYIDSGKDPSNFLKPSMYKEFFGDIYTEQEADWIMHLCQKISVESGSGRIKDYKSRFLNVMNGERYTAGQPLKYKNTIYFVGPCFVYGAFVEDKNTIESILQKKINESKYDIKVVNYGSPAHDGNIVMQLACIMQMPLVKGDIVFLYAQSKTLQGILEINLINALKNQDIHSGWMTDSVGHCNDKINILYAKYIFGEVEPLFSQYVQNRGERVELDNDVYKKLYINRYFWDFNPSVHNKIGSIVMNCNPFTYGHRYLVEQALNVVDFLIIFVVEEDRSIFTFDERFAFVCEGVADLENVKVVPSGPFILSQTTFPEYFIKTADEDLVENVENDITLFAEKIAPCLNIKYRFVGEEPEDAVTNEYNLAMKRILPKNGIELIEIPRKEQEGRFISATSVRKCLEENNITELQKLVPQSTVKLLFGEMWEDKYF